MHRKRQAGSTQCRRVHLSDRHSRSYLRCKIQLRHEGNQFCSNNDAGSKTRGRDYLSVLCWWQQCSSRRTVPQAVAGNGTWRAEELHFCWWWNKYSAYFEAVKFHVPFSCSAKQWRFSCSSFDACQNQEGNQGSVKQKSVCTMVWADFCVFQPLQKVYRLAKQTAIYLTVDTV